MKKYLLVALFFCYSLFSFSQKPTPVFALGNKFDVKSDGMSLIFKSGNKLKDLKMEKVFEVIREYDYVRDPPSNYILFPKYKGKYGALKITGNYSAKVVMPFEYDAYFFDQVYDGERIVVRKGALWGIVSDTGSVIIPVKQPTKPLIRESFIAVKVGARYHLYSRSGVKLPVTIKDTSDFQYKHSNLLVFHDEKNKKHIYSYELRPLFSDSIVKVRVNDYFLKIDLLNKTSVVVDKESGKRFYNVTEADNLTDFVYHPYRFADEYIDPDLLGMEQEINSGYKALQNDKGKKALMDSAFNLVTKFEYDSIARLYYKADSSVYFHLVLMMKNKKWAIYELPLLKQLTRHQYENVILNQKSCWLKKNNQWEVYKIADYKKLYGWAIDRGNPTVVFDSIKESYRKVAVYMKENKLGVIDFEGNPIVAPEYTKIQVEGSYSGNYYLSNETKTVIFNEDFKTVTGPYNTIGSFHHNYTNNTILTTKYNGKMGALNWKNEPICKMEYDTIYYYDNTPSWAAKKGRFFDIISPELKKTTPTNYINLVRQTDTTCRSGWFGFLATDSLGNKIYVDSIGVPRYCNNELYFVPKGKKLVLMRKGIEEPVLNLKFDRVKMGDSLDCKIGWIKEKLYLIQSDLSYEIYNGMGKIQYNENSELFFEAYKDEKVFVLNKQGVLIKK
ncbi:MAG: hypothetical protein KA163_13730 [Bacteroidia bacterium]|nr:hypothetical protein [Bacteroidia bacterium]